METPERQLTTPETASTTESTDLASESWHVIMAKVRIDSFNQELLTERMMQARTAGHLRIALDLRTTRFISLSSIKFLVQFAKELAGAGGQMAFLAPSEKTKRHFEIYGSLAHIVVFRPGQVLNITSQVELVSKSADDASTLDYSSDTDSSL